MFNRFQPFIVATLFIPTLVHANFSGIYLGVSAGGNHFASKHGFESSTTDVTEQKKNVVSYIGDVFAGIKMEIAASKIIVGTEAFASMSGLRSKATLRQISGALQGNLEIKHKQSYGIAVIAGRMINPKLLGYAGVGLERANLEFNYSNLAYGTSKTETIKKTSTLYVPRAGMVLTLGRFRIGGQYELATFPSRVLRGLSEIKNGVHRGYKFKGLEHRFKMRFYVVI